MGGWGDDAEVDEEGHGDTGGSGRTQTRPRRNVRALSLSSLPLTLHVAPSDTQ